jgi:hypothetical protein
VHEFPEGAPVIFLPAQAAADTNLLEHINKARARGAHLIVTTSLLVALPDSDGLARMVKAGTNIQSKPIRASLMTLSPKTQKLEKTNVIIDLESPIEVEAGPGDILCTFGDKQVALLTVSETSGGSISLLNTHTYSQADFDAVGEVLLCPRPLGLLAMQGPALSALRNVFGNHMATDNDAMAPSQLRLPAFDGPSCVTFHPFGPSASGSCVIQNFNDKAVNVTVAFRIREGKPHRFVEAFTGKSIPIRATKSGKHTAMDLLIPARGRIWVRRPANGGF